MHVMRKALLGIGGLAAAAVVGTVLYVSLALPTCTLLPPLETVSPSSRFTAVVQRRQCTDPKNDWAMVLLRAPDRADQPVVFELREANGPIAVRWADWSRLEIRYPVGARTRQSSQWQGWPSVRYLEVENP
jgi:hypothetical protein